MFVKHNLTIFVKHNLTTFVKHKLTTLVKHNLTIIVKHWLTIFINNIITLFIVKILNEIESVKILMATSIFRCQKITSTLKKKNLFSTENFPFNFLTISLVN